MKHKLVILALIILVASILAVSDTSASIADTSIPDEVAASVSEADNSDSASATIMITMYALPDEGGDKV